MRAAHCDRTGISTPIVIAPMPAQPLPGSIATASTLAFALVHKYVDGTPLYRLAQAFARAGVPVSRGALGHWVIGSSERHLHRIYDALKSRLRSQAIIHGDETTVQVLKEKDRQATSTSYMWAYRSGEDSEQPIVLFDYQPGRGQEHPQAFLGDYRGIVMSDGYSAWRTLKGATHVGCMAHARRRFVDALKARKKPGGPPAQALKFFDQLYRIERQARDEGPDDGEPQADDRRRFRQKHSVPVLNALKAWLDAIAPKVVPDTKLGDAVSYTLNQWDYLTRYTRRRQDADRQQPSGARHQNLCHRKKELALQRYRGGRQGQRRHLQPDVDLPGLPRRTLRVVATRSHRTAAASRRCRYRGPAALQLQKTASLNPALRRVLNCALSSVVGVRRDKAALSSGCKSHPATAPAGSNRSSHGGNEMAEAFG